MMTKLEIYKKKYAADLNVSHVEKKIFYLLTILGKVSSVVVHTIC